MHTVLRQKFKIRYDFNFGRYKVAIVRTTKGIRHVQNNVPTVYSPRLKDSNQYDYLDV